MYLDMLVRVWFMSIVHTLTDACFFGFVWSLILTVPLYIYLFVYIVLVTYCDILIPRFSVCIRLKLKTRYRVKTVTGKLRILQN